MKKGLKKTKSVCINMNNNIVDYLLQNKPEARELLRCSLKNYIKVFHYYLYKTDFIFKDYHLNIIDKLEKIVFNTEHTKHLSINISPRTGKSQLIRYFISWLIAVKKQESFIYTSYSEKLVMSFSTEIRDLIDSELYNKLFNISLQKDTTSKELWKIENGGQLLASPIQGGITGFGSSITVIDDPMNSLDFRSKTIKDKVAEVYSNTLKSRFNDKRKGRFILIMQRLAKDDLTGYLMENEPDLWDFVSIPAINEKGESIFPEMLPIEFLEQEKKINNFTFQAQYMQNPIAEGGNVIKTEWFKYYQLLPRMFQVYITCDTACKTKDANDYSVLQCWGKEKHDGGYTYYLIEQVRGKWESPELLQHLKAFYIKHKTINKCSQVIIEDKASGTGLIQNIQRMKIPVKGYNPKGDKYQRLSEVLPKIASGYVYLPENASWLNDFLVECEDFSADLTQPHDDQIDAMVYALNDDLTLNTMKGMI